MIWHQHVTYTHKWCVQHSEINGYAKFKIIIATTITNVCECTKCYDGNFRKMKKFTRDMLNLTKKEQQPTKWNEMACRKTRWNHVRFDGSNTAWMTTDTAWNRFNIDRFYYFYTSIFKYIRIIYASCFMWKLENMLQFIRSHGCDGDDQWQR